VSLGIRGIYRSILRREDIDSKQHPKRCKLPPMLDGYAETLAAANAATMSQTSRGVNEHLKGFRESVARLLDAHILWCRAQAHRIRARACAKPLEQKHVAEQYDGNACCFRTSLAASVTFYRLRGPPSRARRIQARSGSARRRRCIAPMSFAQARDASLQRATGQKPRFM
jgi:hypothetical protein